MKIFVVVPVKEQHRESHRLFRYDTQLPLVYIIIVSLTILKLK